MSERRTTWIRIYVKNAYSLLLFLIIISCVDPIAFDIPSVSFTFVVDGSITDRPGPYRVFLGRAASLDQDLDFRRGITGATVTIKSDQGDNEVLIETSNGNYETRVTQGIVGRSYWITIVTADGAVYESAPEKLNAAGELQSITTEFEDDFILVNNFGENKDKFNVSVNATGSLSTGNYMRWRTTGTYGILTFPHLITTNIMGVLIPNPPPCSGYDVVNGFLTQIDGCECCECWVSVNDRLPFVSDDAVLEGGIFKNVFIGSVPVTRRTFYDKYHVSVEQIAHTQQAFEYFRLIKAQKDGATSLFQPPSGKLRGNIHRLDSKEEVLGYFWAGGITSKSTFITRDMVPYRVPRIDTVIIECHFLNGATADRPEFWR
jgi:hypothetical protein